MSNMTQLKSKSIEYNITRTKKDFPKAQIKGSVDINRYVRQFYFDDIDIYESCFAVFLNRANTTIGYAKISQGGINGTVVDIKIICKYAIEALASAVILVHNHPSGAVSPSIIDDKITKSIKDALNILDIDLLDHLIVTSDGYFSYADQSML